MCLKSDYNFSSTRYLYHTVLVDGTVTRKNTVDTKIDTFVDIQNRSFFWHDKFVEFYTQSRLKGPVETDIVIDFDFFIGLC